MQLIAPLLALSLSVVLTSAQSTTVASPPTTTWALTPQQTCLNNCKAGDVNCQAACIGSAHPNSIQISQANSCATACTQGDGSVSAINAWNSCIAGCLSSYYPTTQTVAPAVISSGSSSVASVKASATGPSSAGSSGSVAAGSGSGTASGSAASASPSKAAGSATSPFVGGLAGIFFAALAL